MYAPTFTLTGGYSVSLGQGSSTTSYISVNPEYGFTGSVALSVSGLPSGVTALWTPNPTTGTSTLTLSASNSAPAGQYNLTITGTSGSTKATTTLALGIYAPSFTLATYSSVSLGQGTSGTAYFYITPQYGFTGNVTMSVSGLPSGVTASFSPNPASTSSVLTLTASSTAAPGQYQLTITGTSGTQTQTATLNVGVYAPSFTLTSYAGVTVGQGTSSTGYVYVTPQYGFSGTVTLSVSGLPSGVTASFTPNPTTGTSTLTVNASSTAAIGQYTLTVTGTSGTQTVTSSLTLGVYTPDLHDFCNLVHQPRAGKLGRVVRLHLSSVRLQRQCEPVGLGSAQWRDRFFLAQSNHRKHKQRVDVDRKQHGSARAIPPDSDGHLGRHHGHVASFAYRKRKQLHAVRAFLNLDRAGILKLRLLLCVFVDQQFADRSTFRLRLAERCDRIVFTESHHLQLYAYAHSRGFGAPGHQHGDGHGAHPAR